MPFPTSIRPRFLDSRGTLLFGFGGFLLLLLIGGNRIDTSLERARSTSATMREGFLRRNQLLNQLRSDIVVEGTYIRDYLLDPSPQSAAAHLERLTVTQSEIDDILAREELRQTGLALDQFLAAYRQYRLAIAPPQSWTAEQRRTSGYPFLRDVVFPSRTGILLLADALGRWNETQLDQSARSMEALHVATRETLHQQFLWLAALGFALAALTFWRISRLERERRMRIADLEQARAELRDLSSRLVQVQEDERKRISRELHDEVAQNLSAIRVGLERIHRESAPVPHSQLAESFAELSRLTDQSLKSTRQMSSGLRPSMLDDLGLVPALHWLAKEYTRRSPVQVFVEADDELAESNESARVCIYRIVQEALENSIRHGQSSEVRIRASRTGSHILVSVQDNGAGFEVHRHRGLGILGMTERVESLGGKFRIESQPGVGTVVMAELP